MKSIIQPFHCSPYSDCLWKPRTASITPLRLPSCGKKHLILGAIGNGENRASQDVELDQQQTTDLQFGIRIGGDSNETSSKVIGKKSIKGMDGLLLKRPLPNTEVRKLTDFPSSQTGSKNNTGKIKSLDLVRPVKRKEGKEAVSSDLNRLGSHTKTFLAESNSRNITDEVVLRKKHAQNKASETLGFVSHPITPYFLSNKKEDKSKRHLEDTGLLRRPEAQATRIDDKLNEISRDLKAEEVIIENLLESKNNTGKIKSLDLVRPVKRKEGKEAVSSDLNRLGSHTKTFLAESNSRNITNEVVLRKPHAQNKASETLGFVSHPITPYFLSNKKEDKSKRHLEDTGLLRRPEAQATRIDDKLNEIPRDLKAEEVIIENLLESKTDNAIAHDAAHKQITERGDMKREHKISAIRPTLPKNPLMSTAHEMDSHKSNRNAGHESYHEMHGMEDVTSFSSRESRGMNDSAPASVKTDKILKADVNISGLFATPPAKMNHQEEKQCIQDCEEGADFKAESQIIQQTTSIGVESVKLKALRLMRSARVYLSEENAVKRKSREDSPRHPLVNEISGQQNIHVCSETDAGLDLPPCRKEFEEKTHISDGPEDDSEKILSHLIHSFPSDHSDGTEDVLDKKVHQSSSDDSELQKLLHEMVPHASSRHTKKFESNVQISNQAKEISQAAKEGEDRDWAFAKILHSLGGFEEVELVSCSDIGFIVSFGSLSGLLPYRNLSNKKRPLPFGVWLQKKMSDPLKFQKEIGLENRAHLYNIMSMQGLIFPNNEAAIKSEEQKSSVTAHESENLLNWYNQDREKFLSSFLGQKIRAAVTLVDRKSGRLIFSEKEEKYRDFRKKKANVMDRMNIGDIVTCQVTGIGSFGVFVQLEGVSALIHHSELSWDPDWDANLHLKVGEVLKVKVCGLDHSLHRINLSLKQLKPDPLLKSLESIFKEDDDHAFSILEHAELNIKVISKSEKSAGL